MNGKTAPWPRGGARAVFLDKDGTLIEDVPYNVDPARVRLTAGAGLALQRFAQCGLRLIVVSNQPGVAAGRFAEQELRGVEARIAELLAPWCAAIAGFYYCVHAPTAGCTCRKPAPGLLRRAAAELGVALAASWLVGDILDDVEAGKRAGCRAALVDNGNETEWRRGALRVPDVMAPSLDRVAVQILRLDAENRRACKEAAHALAGRR